MKRTLRLLIVASLVVSEASLRAAANLTNELIAYWPLDQVLGTKTPDLVNGYDMTLNNLTTNDLVPGKKGLAFQFDNTRKTLLSRVHSAGEKLPINQHDALTVSLWAMVAGLGQSDLRLFSEANTSNSDPLFNLGTDSGGASGALDIFFRQSGWTIVNHIKTVSEPLDGQWHQITFAQDADGQRRIYIDGVKDELEIAAKEAGAWRVTDTTIGGILRSSASHWVSGVIDEVAVWGRALSDEEIGLLYTNGLPNIGPAVQPLEVRQFAADFGGVAKGDKVVLRWDVSKDATISIDHNIGDVTALSQFGVGSIEVTVSSNTTYTLTLTRGAESLTAAASVAVVDNVAAGWRLLDNLERLNPGPIAGQGNWKSPDGVGWVASLGANQVLAYDGGDDLAALDLKSLTLKEGRKATLFFRFYASDQDTDNAVGVNVGLTERPIRFIGDFAQDVGPYLRFERAAAGDPISVLARNGSGALYDPAATTIDLNTVYDVWIDIQNGPNDGASTGDIYSVYVQKDGVAGRTRLFQDYLGDRNPAGSPDLGLPKPDLESVVAAAVGTGQGTNNVYLDDFFLSNTNYLDTVPVPASSFVQTQQIQISAPQYLAANSTFSLTWSSQPGSTYTIQRKTSLSDSSWTSVAAGYPTGGATGTSTTFTDNLSGQPSGFYRIVYAP